MENLLRSTPSPETFPRMRSLDPRLLLLALAVLIGAAAFAGPRPAGAAGGVLPDGFADQQLASGLDQPVGLDLFPDGRIVTTELKTGRVWLLIADTLASSQPLFTVDSVRTDFSERGLLGIAVDARWPWRPYLYVHYTHLDGTVHVARFTVTGDLSFTGNGQLQVDPASRYDVLRGVPDVNGPHNGGTLRFGPDAMLYASFGDDNQGCPAQNVASPLGKILRLDVALLPPGPGGPPDPALITPPFHPFPSAPDSWAGLVWAYGFRNPFRFTIDPQLGDLYVMDVGDFTFEEADRVAAPGMDFGWPMFEGTLPTTDCGSVATLTGPVYELDRSELAACATNSVALYRQHHPAPWGFPAEYDGDFLFCDLVQGDIRRLRNTNGTWTIAPPVAGQTDPQIWGTGFLQATDWVEGLDGAMYYVNDTFGEVRRIVNTTAVGVPGTPSAAAGVTLAAPWPSPARDAVAFAYTLPSPAAVSLAVFAVDGRRVRVLEAGAERAATRHVVRWDGRDETGARVPAGVYYARLAAGGTVRSQRVVLLP